jgi:signal transduction histidine kinase
VLTILTLLLGCLSGLSLLAAIRQRSWVVQVMTVLLLTSVVLSVSTSFWVVEPTISILTLMAAVVLMSNPLLHMTHLLQLTVLLIIHMLSPAVSSTFSLGLLTLVVLSVLVSRLLQQHSWSLWAGLLTLCLLALPATFNQVFICCAALFSWWLIVSLAGRPNSGTTTSQPLLQAADAEAIRTQERSRIYQNIHDDVGADLLKLVYQTEDQAQQTAIKNIMSRLREAVAKTEHRQLNLNDLLTEISAETQSACEAAGLTFHSTIDVGPVRLDLDLTVHLQRMIRELTSNCIKHARATELTLTATTGQGLLLLSLQDDGIGLPAGTDAGSPLGKGLSSLHKRAARHGATIEWSGAAGQGTTVDIQVPLA